MERSGLGIHFNVDGRGSNWWSYGLTRATAWEAFHKLEQIVRPRTVFLGTIAATRPGALYTILGASATLAAFLTWVAMFILVHRVSPVHGPIRALAFGLLEAGAAILAFKLTNLLLEPKSTVTLRHSDAETTRHEERRFALWVATISAALGFIAGVILDVVARKLLHW